MGLRVEAGCSEERTPGGSSPGPAPTRASALSRFSPRLTHWARHLPSKSLRGRRSVGRVRPAVRGTGFWGDQMAWRLSVDGGAQPPVSHPALPRGGRVAAGSVVSSVRRGQRALPHEAVEKPPGAPAAAQGAWHGGSTLPSGPAVASGTSFADPAQSSSRGLFFVSCVLRWHPRNSKIFPRLHSQPSGSRGSLPPTE